MIKKNSKKSHEKSKLDQEKITTESVDQVFQEIKQYIQEAQARGVFSTRKQKQVRKDSFDFDFFQKKEVGPIRFVRSLPKEFEGKLPTIAEIETELKKIKF